MTAKTTVPAAPLPVSKNERLAAACCCLFVFLLPIPLMFRHILSEGFVWQDALIALSVFVVPHIAAVVWFSKTRPAAVAGAAAASLSIFLMYLLYIIRPSESNNASFEGLMMFFFGFGGLAAFFISFVAVFAFPKIYRRRPVAAAATAAATVALAHTLPYLFFMV
ncbi:hypothetical protein [Neisseria sp.]|uniref:hypothetical protein n=1 Tax=Neisseria sp. TaxID=192066 RepID=UPI0035A1877F